jgi:hypothetical protein
MMTKTIGKREPARTPEEFHALGAKLDQEIAVIGAPRSRGFVLKARTWEELERWENDRLVEHARKLRVR